MVGWSGKRSVVLGGGNKVENEGKHMRVRNLRKSLLLLAVALVLPSANVEAQDVKTFSPVCVMGSLRPCGSVIITTLWTPPEYDDDEVLVAEGFTSVTMLVRNEQGSVDFDNTGGSFLTAIGLTAPDIFGVANFSVTADAANVVGTDPGGFWTPDNKPVGGQVTFSAGTQNLQGGIRGCDPALGNPTNYFITCDSGWITFQFTTTNNWNASQAEIVLKYQSIEGAYIDDGEFEDISLVCHTGPGDDDNDHPCAVVPEPSTWALLLTGMVGILGMGWLRRKQEDTT